MNKRLLQETYQFYNMLPKNLIYTNYIMAYGATNTRMSAKKMSIAELKSLSDVQYYKEHSKHHSMSHIKAMKELQKLGVNREKSHIFVKKYQGK